MDPLFVYACFSVITFLGVTWLGVRQPLLLVFAVLILYLATR